MRTLAVAALTILLILAPSSPALALAAASRPFPADVAVGPQVTADAAVLIDATTGRVLWSRGAEEPRAPASTTKMMTALVALEEGNLKSVVTVSPAADATPGSSAHLRAGERYTLAQLLVALLLPSGNDAAVAIAEHVAGSVPAFAERMNAKARVLGLVATHFTNPHGLTAAGHYSSALDLALIARAGLRIPEFARIVDTAEAQIAGTNSMDQEIRRELHNTNRLLVTYGWVNGVKTGTTDAAGSCLVASAARGGVELIAVVLHSSDRWGDALRLLQWGYAHFSMVQPAAKGQVITTLPVRLAQDPTARVPVVAAADLTAPLALDELPRMRLIQDLPAAVDAPVRRGQLIGTLQLRVAGQPFAEVPLVAASTVKRVGLPLLWWRQLQLVLRGSPAARGPGLPH